MPDVAITNGGLIPRKNLRFANFVGTITTTNQTLVAAVADKQIVVWNFGGWSNGTNVVMRLFEGVTIVRGTNIGTNSNNSNSDTPMPYVLPTNTLIAADIASGGLTGGFWVIYSLIDPIDRT